MTSTMNGLNNSPESYFRDGYDEVMYTGIIGKYSRLVHKLMERPYKGKYTPKILEVGAGKGQHVVFVASKYDEYVEVDIDPELAVKNPYQDSRVTRYAQDAQDLSLFADDTFDRVIATCLLAHLEKPEQALREWRRVLKPGGGLTIYVPAEPGMLLRAGRSLVVAPKSRRFGQDHHGVVYRDHRNHYPAMRHIIRDVFKEDEIRKMRFPLPFLGWNFAIFDIFQIQKDAK